MKEKCYIIVRTQRTPFGSLQGRICEPVKRNFTVFQYKITWESIYQYYVDNLSSDVLNNISISFFPQYAQKILKSNRQFCSKLGKYRMPFAWAVRQVDNCNQQNRNKCTVCIESFSFDHLCVTSCFLIYQHLEECSCVHLHKYLEFPRNLSYKTVQQDMLTIDQDHA